MPRSRNVKPSLFKNEELGTADPLLTLLFISLWCLADKAGRLEDRPLRIKAETFPYRDGLDINGYLTELERLGFIRRYKVGEKLVIQIVNFSKHQNPHHTEKDSELPCESTTCQTTVKEPLNTRDTPADSGFLIPENKNMSESKDSNVELEIFEFWKDVCKIGKQAKFTLERRKKVRSRLAEGYTPDRIKNAIRGLALRPHNNGKNDNGTKYNDLELICRNSTKLEGYEQTYLDAQAKEIQNAPAEPSILTAEDWLEMERQYTRRAA